MATEILSVTIWQKSANYSRLRSLDEPIDIYFKVKEQCKQKFQHKLINGSAILPNSTADEVFRDLSITVYKLKNADVESPMKIFVKFHGLKSSDSFRVSEMFSLCSFFKYKFKNIIFNINLWEIEVINNFLLLNF